MLQTDIIKNPDVGALITGTGGLRKVRLAPEHGGKSGGFRIIYLFVKPDTVYLLLVYKKGRKDSLTQGEKNTLKALTINLVSEHEKRNESAKIMLKNKRD